MPNIEAREMNWAESDLTLSARHFSNKFTYSHSLVLSILSSIFLPAIIAHTAYSIGPHSAVSHITNLYRPPRHNTHVPTAHLSPRCHTLQPSPHSAHSQLHVKSSSPRQSGCIRRVRAIPRRETCVKWQKDTSSLSSKASRSQFYGPSRLFPTDD